MIVLEFFVFSFFAMKVVDFIVQSVPLDMFKPAELLEDIFDEAYPYYYVGARLHHISQQQSRGTRNRRTRREKEDESTPSVTPTYKGFFWGGG